VDNFKDSLGEIKKIFLFRDLGEPGLRALLGDSRAEALDFASGETIYSETQYRKSLGIILAGKAEVQTGGADHTVILNRLSSPQLFGAAGLFQEDEEYVTRIVALEKTRILFIPQDLLCDAMQRNFKLVENYLAFLTQRIRFLNRKIGSFTQPQAENKLAGYLLDTAEDQQSLSVTLPVSLQDVAKVLNLGRASLYRALDILEDAGVIVRKNKRVTICDREALESLCLQRP
jgi:CRP-like cAMP-binding protein